MGFETFFGNQAAVALLRSMITRERLPHALLFSGPTGVGKYTLAQMLAKALHCEDEESGLSGDFCGHCRNCITIGLADDRYATVAKAEEEREKLSKRPREIPLVIQNHQDVILLPPNGPLRLFQIEQARQLKESLTFASASGRRRLFILPEVERMDAAASNALLKSLEEPPQNVTLLLTTSGAESLLPTIRSRCVTIWMGPLKSSEIATFLRSRGSGTVESERNLRATLANGSPGTALRMNLAHAIELRDDILKMLHSGIHRKGFGELFAQTQKWSRNKEPLEKVVQVLYSLMQDILHLETKGSPEHLRNADRAKELLDISRSLGSEGVAAAAPAIANLEKNLRRNVSMQIALEAFAVGLTARR